jgi:tetratricopeptide (TPR) repeat protein
MNTPRQPSAPDHNLLLGVLALQSGLIDAANFAEACSAWAARQDAALADVLAERGWLGPADRADLERLVQRRLGASPPPASVTTKPVADEQRLPGAVSLLPEPGPRRSPLWLLALTCLLLVTSAGLGAYAVVQGLALRDARDRASQQQSQLQDADVARKAAEAERQREAARLHEEKRVLAEGRRDRGLAALGRKDYDRAVADLADALELGREDVAPQLVEAYTQRGQLALDRKEAGQALADFTEALHLAPKDARLWQRRGLAYRALARYPLAINDLDNALHLDDKLSHAYLDRGEVYRLKRDYEHALADLNRAVEQDPKSAEARAARAGLYVARRDPEQAAADFKAAVDLAPDDYTLYDNFAIAHLAAGERADAESLLRRSLELRKKAHGDRDPAVAVGLENLGYHFVKGLEYAKAEPFYQEALELRRQVLPETDPLLPRTMDVLGELRRRQDDPAGALGWYEQALALRRKSLGPDHVDVAMSQGNVAGVLADQGKLVEAELQYEQAVAVAKKAAGEDTLVTAGLLHGLGGVLQARGEHAQARRCLEQALSVRKRFLGPLNADTAATFDRLAVSLAAEGQTDRAREYFESAVEGYRESRGPEDEATLEALEHLGGLLYATGEWDKAKAALGEAAEGTRKALGVTNPKYTARRLAYAAALARAGEVSAAAREADAEAARKPGAAAQYDLGRVYAVCAAMDADSRADQYSGRALEHLTTAEAAGFFKEKANRDRLEQDKDLDALRKRPEFAALLEKVKKG